MTLMDFNPMVEPSWLPGSYQLPGPAAAGKRDKAGPCEQQPQQPQYGQGKHTVLHSTCMGPSICACDQQWEPFCVRHEQGCCFDCIRL
jgi:hypothetical protein